MRRTPLKSHCFGPSQKLLDNLLYVQELCRDSSIREPFQWCETDVENTCLNRPFWTGLRPKHDIIGGAWSRCYLNQEKAYATL